MTVKGGPSVSKPIEIQTPIAARAFKDGVLKLTVPLAHVSLIASLIVLNVLLVGTSVVVALPVSLAMILQVTVQSVSLAFSVNHLYNHL